MASSPVTSWQIDGETMETVTDFIFLDSRITADGNCSHEIKRHLLLGRKVMTTLDSVKIRDIPLPTKVRLVKAMVFPVVLYGCESWTIKKPECWRIDAFELWCWRRLLRVPWTAKRSNQSILKEIKSWIFIRRTEAAPEAPILWPPDVKNWLIGKDPDVGKDWGQEEQGMTEDEMVGWHHRLDGVWANSRRWWRTGKPGMLHMSLSKLWELMMDREAWCPVVHGVTKSRTWPSDWTELNWGLWMAWSFYDL